MPVIKKFVTNYCYRNIYVVVDGAGTEHWIAEPMGSSLLVTQVGDSFEELKRNIDKEIIFTKLHKTRVL